MAVHRNMAVRGSGSAHNSQQNTVNQPTNGSGTQWHWQWQQLHRVWQRDTGSAWQWQRDTGSTWQHDSVWQYIATWQCVAVAVRTTAKKKKKKKKIPR
jgi:hypothetical protein